MLTNYYTLRQLVTEWNSWICDSKIEELYSQRKGELSILIEDQSGAVRTLVISVQAPLRYITSNDSSTKARKNVAQVFSSVNEVGVADISIDSNDRLIQIRLVDHRALQIEVFGPSANVYLINEKRRVLDSFRKVGHQLGEEVTEAIARQEPKHVLFTTEGTVEKRIRKAYPNMGKWYAEKVLARSSQDGQSKEITDVGLTAITDSAYDILAQLESPCPTLYWKGPNAHLLSMIPLYMPEEFRAEEFPTADEAVRVYVRRKLSQTAFDKLHSPLEKKINSRLVKATRSQQRMFGELEKGNKADQHEHFGHLLMSMPTEVTAGSESVTLQDIISGEGEVTIPLKSNMSPVQNAERYYVKARESRQARFHLEKRCDNLETEISNLQKLAQELSESITVGDVRTFLKRNEREVASISTNATNSAANVPYRRYELEDDYEVWVGRNATQNDRLTTKDARKYDIWLHARGVAGSHTVLRVPRRQEKPPAKIIEKAASIAAYHSKARTSEFAPVIVVEKRYVRKPRKSPLGTVVVEREEVLIVKPEIPEQ